MYSVSLLYQLRLSHAAFTGPVMLVMRAKNACTLSCSVYYCRRILTKIEIFGQSSLSNKDR